MRVKRRTWRALWTALKWLPVLAAAALLYIYIRPPSRAQPADIRVDASPERIERGQYLFTALADCDGCHSERDFSRLGGPVVSSGRGKGMVMPLEGLPGRIVASNITPDKETGIGSWTDGEKIRAIREGIGKDGRALFPLMPYEQYRSMADEDVQALVAYMNALPPVKNALPRTEVSFPASIWIKSNPAPVTHEVPTPDPDGGEIFGEYLATLANCEGCHTPAIGRNPDTSLRFAGGRIFATSFGTVASANITPDEATGIGSWTITQFLERMRQYRRYDAQAPPVAGPGDFTWMPWAAYSRLSDADLEALFLYVRSRTPVSNRVDIHPGRN